MKKRFCVLAFLLLVTPFGLISPASTQAVVKVRMQTVMGTIDVELFDEVAPLTVANFLNYVHDGDYDNTFIHRSDPGFIIQGGGFSFENGQAVSVLPDPPVSNEFNLSNLRGTIAMAKPDAGPDTATNQWFFNLGDNSENLDNQNGGFTVFGQVMGNDMAVVDAIAGLPIWRFNPPFEELPLINYTSIGEPIQESNLVMVHRVIELPPAAGVSNDAIVDFGASGIWVWMNNTSWTKLHPSTSDTITTGDMDGDGRDEAVIDFASSGIWVWMNNAAWTKLHPSNPDAITTGDLDGNRLDEVIIDFGVSGIWVRMNNARWTKLHPSNPESITTGDLDGNGLDDAIIDFGASGVWVWMNNTSWIKLHSSNPDSITTGDLDGNGLDDAIIDFGASGVWVWVNNGLWTKLHPLSPETMTTGDLDGNGQDDAIIDFGAGGVWVWMNNGTWAKLHPSNPDSVATGDLDNNGKDEVIIDFGPSGLWVRYNDVSWSKLHGANGEMAVTGNLDGN